MHLNCFAFCDFQLNKRLFFIHIFHHWGFLKNSVKISSRLVLVNPISCLVSWSKRLVTPLQYTIYIYKRNTAALPEGKYPPGVFPISGSGHRIWQVRMEIRSSPMPPSDLAVNPPSAAAALPQRKRGLRCGDAYERTLLGEEGLSAAKQT